MQFISRVFRHSVFVIFIICNAIIASASVWHFRLSQALQQELRIDTYMTFVGASGLLFISSIIGLELLRKDSITGRVWFECSWVGLYWMLELAAASAISALGPRVMCDRMAVNAVSQSCSSTMALLAFSWTCTITLMCYFLFLIVSTATYQLQERDSSIWQREVREFPWLDQQSSMKRTSPTPFLCNSGQQASTIIAPQPRQASAITPPQQRQASPAERYPHRGLSVRHKIEYYQPPTTFSQPALPEPAIPGHRQRVSIKRTPTAIYPKAVESGIAAPSLPAQYPDSRQRPPSPSPLGDWPRADIMSRPSHSRPSKRPPPLLMQQPSVGVAPSNPFSLP